MTDAVMKYSSRRQIIENAVFWQSAQASEAIANLPMAVSAIGSDSCQH
jgi:hypothetical protein